MTWLPVDRFCNWLATTPASDALQTVEWVVPAVQTVHILAVAAVVSSALMIDFRLLGWGSRDQSIAAVGRRFLPFVWWPLSVLLVTGAVLITAEPARALENPVFMLKMALLTVVAGVTLACQWPLRRDPAFWDAPHRRWVARAIALCSLPLWVGIVFAGRWIAYVQGI